MSRSRSARRPITAVAAGSLALGLALVAVPGADAARPAAAPAATPSPARPAGADASRERAPDNVDVRQLPAKQATRRVGALVRKQTPAARAQVRSLGQFANVDYDPLTGTPRMLGRLDGYLTAPSSLPARTVALDYVRSHADLVGLDAADLGTLVFRKNYVDTLGLHNLSWTQRINGTPLFGNGLMAKVTSTGRLLSISGSPVHDLSGLAASAPRGELTASGARSAAAADVDGAAAASSVDSSRAGSAARTTWSNGDFAQKVWFLTSHGLRAGWSTYTQTGSDAAYQHVVDATTDATLYRRSTVDHATGDAYVYDYYPGAPAGPKKDGKVAHPGAPKVVNFIKRGWLSKNATTLNGDSVITSADVDDDNLIGAGEQYGVPGTKSGATGRLKTFPDTAKDVFGGDGTVGDGPYAGFGFSKFCSKAFPCTWDAQAGGSWKTNMAADQNNAFYLASAFHDYLQSDKAIGFTPKAGNFTAAGGDPVLQQVLDGADADAENGVPDSAHINNANMNTPPDGTPPTMQMYLWHSPGYPNDYDSYLPSSGAFDASILLHEYTHGLSNRLVVDADGNGTLSSLQSGSMGEAWSDYYAMDYLVTKGFEKDTAKDGEMYEGRYVMGGSTDPDGALVPFRSMPMDCAVGSQAKACYDTYNPDADHQGGYTYGDLVLVAGSPEVHSSGEVWAQTLWDIRKAFGHQVADTLITRGMSLSATNPTMLDMRNAIIQADQVAYGQAHTTALWKLFAKRGMGYYAGAIDAGDTETAEDFHTPPSPASAQGVITGTVTDTNTGDPVAGATVMVAGFGTKYVTTTNAGGEYTLGGVVALYAGTYPKVVVSAPGYFTSSQAVTVPATGGSTTADYAVRYDWAATGAGASVLDFNGPDYTDYGCGPAQALDTLFGTGWGSASGTGDEPSPTFEPKHLEIKLPQAVDIASFGVDPTSTCGDAGSASTGDYRIEVSVDGTLWTPVTPAGAHFGIDDRGTLNEVTPTTPALGVRYVRFTILGNQVPDASGKSYEETCTADPGSYDGCTFADLTELAVFGTPAS
ncbi:M36 family metallopeptidase [Nocardioides sp. CN2-186]|uniref:M36 family metallopeptidase n=1 Tax=Nocardioides tweenelious TaxID=3156607 RepID=UPI0032B47EC4